MPNIIVCTCGAEIGCYTEHDGHIYLLSGNLRIRDEWGWCDRCGREWIFNSSEKKLEALIQKLIDDKPMI